MGLSRSAIIITSPGIPGDKSHLPGSEKDGELWRQYLHSPKGGAWEHDEIRVLRSPDRGLVVTAIDAAKGVDIAVVVYSGHGHIEKRQFFGEEVGESHVMHLGSDAKEEVDWNCTLVNATWVTRIYDACREIVYVSVDEEDSRFRSAKYGMLGFVDERRAQHRRCYDAQFVDQPITRADIYACSPDELAGDTENGGAFSIALTSIGRTLDAPIGGGCNVLSACAATSQARVRLAQRGRRSQRPQCHAASTGLQLLDQWSPPIAVSVR